MPEKESETMRLSMDVLKELIKKYPIDTKRIYATGVSLGEIAPATMVRAALPPTAARVKPARRR